MNFVSISPNFPQNYWQFCDRLHQNGVNVLDEQAAIVTPALFRE